MGVLKLMSRIDAKRFGDPNELPEAKYAAPEDLTELFGTEYEGRDGNTLLMDIYRPGNPGAEKLPVIILIHGGGLMSGFPVMERGACEAMARKGYLVFAPSYRMVTETDACGIISDICSAYDHAESVLGEYGGDPDRMFVIAESAAAYLALYANALKGSEILRYLLGCEAPHPDIRAIAFVSGMFYTARKDFLGLAYPRDIYGERRKDSEFMRYMDPENFEVIKKLPPAILTSSRNDFLRKYTLDYANALKKNRRNCKLVYYGEKNKKLIHAFVTLRPELPESRETLALIDDWFRGQEI